MRWSTRWPSAWQRACPNRLPAWLRKPGRPRDGLRNLVAGYLELAAREQHLYLCTYARGRVQQSLLLADGAAAQFAEPIAAYRAARGADAVRIVGRLAFRDAVVVARSGERHGAGGRSGDRPLVVRLETGGRDLNRYPTGHLNPRVYRSNRCATLFPARAPIRPSRPCGRYPARAVSIPPVR